MCTALWWFAKSYISDIEFSEFHARNYELLTAIQRLESAELLEALRLCSSLREITPCCEAEVAQLFKISYGFYTARKINTVSEQPNFITSCIKRI